MTQSAFMLRRSLAALVFVLIGAPGILSQFEPVPYGSTSVGPGAGVNASAGSIAFTAQFVGTTSVPQTLKLTNMGVTQHAIAPISIHGPFRMTGNCGETIVPTASCDLEVTFSPTVKGRASGFITFQDRLSSRPVMIPLSGIGTLVEVFPQDLVFDEQKVGTNSSPQSIVLTNHGRDVAAINGVNSGRNGDDSFRQTNNCGIRLDPGASCTIGVIFKPTKPGQHGGLIYINNKGGDTRQVVRLSGIGV
jgi:hypothetical protein